MESDSIDRGNCAFTAIKKHIVRMNRGVIIGKIPEHLYSKELIDDGTWELCLPGSSITDTEKGKKIAREVQQRLRLCPELMDSFCDILKTEKATEDLAETIKETYQAKLDEAEVNSKSRLELDFQTLKDELEQHNCDLAQPDAPQNELDVLIKFKINNFIKTCFAVNGVSRLDVYKKLHLLCYELFKIPPRICDWVFETLEKATVMRPKPSNVSDVAPSQVAKQETVSEPLPPLPTAELKELLYNSSLCCQAVSMCTVADYKNLFSQESIPHNFEEISMSISKDKDEVDRYLIATQGQTIYVAFQSEPAVQDWMDTYSSFSEGFKKQTGRIPFIFFWERLREQKQIVLTGFSYGGMLACFVAAVLWKDSCVPIEALEKNVVCITYGQPVITIPLVQQVIKDFPHFQDTIYCVFDRDDLFPTILRHFSCTQYTSSRGSMTTLSKSASPGCSAPSEYDDLGSDQTFKEHGVCHRFLSDLSLLQMSEISYSTVTSGSMIDQGKLEASAMSRIKQDLTEAQPHVKSDVSLLCGRYCFQITHKEGQGLAWTDIPSKEHASQMLGSISKIVVESFEVSTFWKHKIEDYRAKMLRAFVLKEPDKFPLPQPKVGKFTQVSRLKPNVSHVEVHIFPNEHAVVLEGDNLSFCYEVQLGEDSNVLKIKCPDHLTPRMIQFNFPPNKKTRNINISSDGTMKVTLRSHFSNPIRKRIKVNKESFSFSLREIQLAKYNPTEVIHLAFMSAMLERYSNQISEQGPSKRLKSITHFLEEAVKVVPLESIFSAVAFMDDSSAVECAKAIVASHFKFPVSEVMCSSAQLADIRMRSGVNGDLIERYIQSSIRQASPFVPSKAGKYDLKLNYLPPDEIEVSVLSPSFTYADAIRSHAVMQETIFSPLSRPFPLPGITVKFDTRGQPRSKQTYTPSAIFFRSIVAEGMNVRNKSGGSLDQLSNFSIEHIYPVNSQRRHSMAISTLQSPLEILHQARESLESFIEDHQDESDSSQHLTNEKMLELVKDIFDNKIKICATLLGAFMEQHIKIPLLKESKKSTAELLSSKSAPVAMGVWALFSSTFQELHDMLASMKGNPLVVEIADYIAGVFSDELKKKGSRQSSKYDGKLQFLLQACSRKRVTCSSEYISYSLEHQLCSKPKFDKSTSVKDLIAKWDETFDGDALSLVANSHRPLIARWLKWAVLIHDLRLSLASYTCVGVTGLVNSGKSQLINKLFGIQTQVGTLEKTRTTVPLLYNLDGIINGLDVIDFPGVDDKENNIPELADMLLGLAQVVVFVCDHKRIFTDQAKQWLQQLKNEDVPVILCLTFADELYLHFIAEDKGKPEPTEFKRREIGRELERKLEKIGYHASRKVGFYCFHVPAGYLAEVNAESLKKMGIGSALDVGNELVKVFSKTLKQEDVAKALQERMEKLQRADP